MALTVGTCAVATDKAVSGSGLARTIAEAYIAHMFTVPVLAPKARTAIAGFCQAVATGVISHITANAEVTTVITTADVSLQRVTLVNTQGPSADRTLAQKGTIA